MRTCLESIISQDYAREKIEIIIIDGGSKDDTLKIAREFHADKILRNPFLVEEAGKPLGIDAATNELLVFIDSDNVLPSKEWIKRMVEPFEDPEIVASEPLSYEYRKADQLLTRYVSLIGSDDALDPHVGTYDRFCYLSGRWNETPLTAENRGSYLKIVLKEGEVPPMGANGFIVRKKAMKEIVYKPLHIHTDTVYRLVKSGHSCMAKVKVGIVHLHSNDIKMFARKKLRRIHKYFLWKSCREYYPQLNNLRLLKYALFSILLVPLAADTIKGYKKIPDRAWFFHLLACLLTLFTYGAGYVESQILIKRR